MPDPSLFDTVETHARLTDPASSELTLKSLGKDTSLNWRVFESIMYLSNAGRDVGLFRAVTDDMILTYMEGRYERRFQRNVIARQRGIIRELGWIARAEDMPGPDGRMVVAHVPTDQGVELWRNR